jgi:O-antigen ligase
VAFASWWIVPKETGVRERLASLVNPATYFGETGTFANRVRIWKATLPEIGERPFLGLGAGWDIFEAYMKLHHPDLEEAQDTPHAHNNFLQLAFESGVIAAGLFVALMAALAAQIFRAWRATERQTKRRFVVAGFFALLISITVYGLSNFSLRYSVGMLIWICFALMALLPSIARAIPEDVAEPAGPPPNSP